MHENIKKKIVELIEKYHDISIGMVVKELKIDKALVTRVIEEMRVKDGVLDYNYTDSLVKKYVVKKELNVEQRDNLERYSV